MDGAHTPKFWDTYLLCNLTLRRLLSATKLSSLTEKIRSPSRDWFNTSGKRVTITERTRDPIRIDPSRVPLSHSATKCPPCVSIIENSKRSLTIINQSPISGRFFWTDGEVEDTFCKSPLCRQWWKSMMLRKYTVQARLGGFLRRSREPSKTSHHVVPCIPYSFSSFPNRMYYK